MKPKYSEENFQTDGLSQNFAFATASLFSKVNQFIGRENFIKEVKKCFLVGQKIVGLVGIGGIGKTFAAIKIANNLLSYNKMELKIEKVFFFDGRDGLGATFHSFLVQFIQICELYGEIKLTKIFFDKDNSPKEVAFELIRYLKEREILFVFDNLESWVDEEGVFKDVQLYEFIFNLVQHSKNNLKFMLTSRISFVFNTCETNILNPWWISLKPFSLEERLAALNLYHELSNQPLVEKMEIANCIGEHPYEIGLLSKEKGVAKEQAKAINSKRKRADNFVALDYYLSRLSENELELLKFCSIFREENLNIKLIELFWSFRRKKEKKPFDNFELLIKRIASKGLIAFDSKQEEVQLHPLIKMRLFEKNDSGYLIPYELKVSLYRDLIQFFLSHFEHFEQSNKTKAFGFLANAFNYALLLKDLKFIIPIHQIFSVGFKGVILRHIAMDFFIRTATITLEISKNTNDLQLVLRVIENLIDYKLFKVAQLFLDEVLSHNLIDTNCNEIAFGLQGKIYINLRNWEKAIEAFKNSLTFSTPDLPSPTYGAILHQLGIVYENLENWKLMKEKFLLATKCFVKIKDPKLNIAFQSLSRVRKYFNKSDWDKMEEWLDTKIIMAIKEGWTERAVDQLNESIKK